MTDVGIFNDDFVVVHPRAGRQRRDRRGPRRATRPPPSASTARAAPSACSPRTRIYEPIIVNADEVRPRRQGRGGASPAMNTLPLASVALPTLADAVDEALAAALAGRAEPCLWCGGGPVSVAIGRLLERQGHASAAASAAASSSGVVPRHLREVRQSERRISPHRAGDRGSPARASRSAGVARVSRPSSRAGRRQLRRRRLAGLLRLVVLPAAHLHRRVGRRARRPRRHRRQRLHRASSTWSRSGDTLWQHRRRHYGDDVDLRRAVYDIRKANRLATCGLQPGERLAPALRRRVALARPPWPSCGILAERRDVAQPGSAPALGAGGRRFESARPDQHFFRAGVAQLARASAFQAEGRGFEPRLPLHSRCLLSAPLSASRPVVMSRRRAPVAQLDRAGDF